MAATVQIREKNTAGQTATDKTSGTIRFKKADDATVDLNNPLVVPTSLTEYSYQKWLRMYVSGGTYTQISNLRLYSDGSSGYGSGRYGGKGKLQRGAGKKRSDARCPGILTLSVVIQTVTTKVPVPLDKIERTPKSVVVELPHHSSVSPIHTPSGLRNGLSPTDLYRLPNTRAR